jgi:very-short-patch-repair endonuclease
MAIARHKNKPQDYVRASALRHKSSNVEHLLWRSLRQMPLKFRRQHPIHPYIADFVCLKLRLVVEVDGFSHDATQDYDRRRDIYMRRLGYTVLRFNNNDVMKNLEGVVETILREASMQGEI